MNDRAEQIDDVVGQSEASAEHRSRNAINEHTGHEYVRSRPGARKVTSEEIRKLLEDFP